MKVWRAMYIHEDEGCCVLWAGTKRELALKLREERGYRQGPLAELHTERVVVPRTRAALVNWLNFYISRDNG